MASELEVAEKVYTVPRSEIYVDENFNCRGPIKLHEVQTLAKTISRDGQETPVVLRPKANLPNGAKYHLVSGHRREAAICQVLGRDVINAFIREMTEDQAHAHNARENLERQDLNLMGEARTVLPYKRKRYPTDMIAGLLGRSRNWVKTRQRVLELPPLIQQMCESGHLQAADIDKLSKYHGDELLKLAGSLRDARKSKDKTLIKRLSRKRQQIKTKRARGASEMEELQSRIRQITSTRTNQTIDGFELVGENGAEIATQILGWAQGHNDNKTLHRHLMEYYDLLGCDISRIDNWEYHCVYS